MRITDIREISIPLRGNIANALVNFSEHTVSIVAVMTDVKRDGKAVSGIAFNSIGRFAQGGLLRERFIRRVLGADPGTLLLEDGSGIDPAAVYRAAMKNEKPGGHGDRAAAVSAVELAIWDLNAKLAEEPAYVQIARAAKRDVPQKAVPVYAAGGYYYPDDSLTRLQDEIKEYRDMGFLDYKIKIGGASLARDIERIESLMPLTRGGEHLAVDVNGRFDIKQAIEYARAIEPFRLRWYEEVGDPLDYGLNAELSQNYDGAIATGENLFSSVDVLNLIRFGGMRRHRDYFQMEAGLSYGLTEYMKTIAILEDHGFSREYVLPHGGHLINLHIVAGLGLGGCEVYPGVFQPLGGYPPKCLHQEGHAMPSQAPGFGLEEKEDLRVWIDKILA